MHRLSYECNTNVMYIGKDDDDADDLCVCVYVFLCIKVSYLYDTHIEQMLTINIIFLQLNTYCWEHSSSLPIVLASHSVSNLNKKEKLCISTYNWKVACTVLKNFILYTKVWKIKNL